MRAFSDPKSYWQASRAHRYSLVFALPLLLAYEALAALAPHTAAGEIRNGADVILKELFIAVAGVYGPLLFGVTLAFGSVWLVARDLRARGGGIRPGVFAAMALEATVLAALFGVVVGTLTARLLHLLPALAIDTGPVDALSLRTKVMVSLGAGLYEELLFRVLLVSALAWGARRLLAWGPASSGLLAVTVSATIFSAFHYLGPYGDPLRLDSFVFRLLSGLFFSALYLLRGFGITAWTHALYDLMIVLS